MSDMNENTNPMSVAEPLQPAESAATWLDAVNQAAETAAAEQRLYATHDRRAGSTTIRARRSRPHGQLRCDVG